jgi:hypothetical protein
MAGTIGSFAMSGQITVHGDSSITWNSDISPFDANMFTLSEGMGIYALENGQNGIMTLTNPPDVVGSDFAPQLFIQFDVDPTPSSLDIDYIYPGVGDPANCTAAPNTSGTQTCTIPGSPFTFTNEQNGDSTATFTFAGVTADGQDAWSGTFSANFLVPYQSIVANFINNPGNATQEDTFAGTLDVKVSAVPEPGTLMLIGAGLLALGASKKLRKI